MGTRHMTHLALSGHLASLSNRSVRILPSGQKRMAPHERGQAGSGKDRDRWRWWQPSREGNAKHTHTQSCVGQFAEWQL